MWEEKKHKGSREMDGKVHTLTVDCPKSKVGCVIGKQGKTIKCIEKLTGTRVDVDQTRTPTLISVSSAEASDADFAMTLVRDIISSSFRVLNLDMLRDMLSSDEEEKEGGEVDADEDEDQTKEETVESNIDVRWGWTPWEKKEEELWSQADIIRYCQGF